MNETFHKESTSVDFYPQDAKGATRTTARKGKHANANESDRVKNASVVDVLGEWAASSSVDGLPHAFDREHYNRSKRIVWIVLVLASFVIMIWQVSVLYAEYTKYEVQTNSHIDFPRSIAFPYVIKNEFTNTVAPPRSLTLLSALPNLVSTCSDVTVCNSNPLDAFYVEQEGIVEPRNEEELIAVSQKIDEFIKVTTFKDFDQDVIKLGNPLLLPTDAAGCSEPSLPKVRTITSIFRETMGAWKPFSTFNNFTTMRKPKLLVYASL
jgi:hypothetical protein